MVTERGGMGKTRRERVLFGVLLGLLASALAGSAWAWAREGPCGSCGEAGGFPGARSLAPLGAGFYGGLLALGALFGRTRLLFVCLLSAAAVHAVLLFHMAGRGVFCGPCVAVGSAAILAALLSLVIDPENLARGSLLLPVVALIAQAAILALSVVPPGGGDPATAGAPRPAALSESVVRPGTVKLLVFTRAGCPFCEEFEEKVLPDLRREFGDALLVERRPAPPGLPSPTLVVSGVARSVFPGLPPKSELRRALVLASGDSADSGVLGGISGKEPHEPTLLSEP